MRLVSYIGSDDAYLDDLDDFDGDGPAGAD